MHHALSDTSLHIRLHAYVLPISSYTLYRRMFYIDWRWFEIETLTEAVM
jgi:hypothetical protein